ncbi:MAG: hypothetical protein ABR590_06305 [Spirochaetia bacterium]
MQPKNSVQQGRNFVRPVLAALLIILGAGCSARESQSVVVWTDTPELATYLELFNADQSEYFAELEYHEDPLRLLRTTTREPDIVISLLPTDIRSSDRFRPLDSVIDSVGGAGEFYPDLLKTGEVDGKLLFVPLSFDLPLISFKQPPAPDGHDDSNDIYIELEEIRDRGEQFNRQSGERPTHIGFSPRWDHEFLYLFARLHGLEFRHSGVESFDWNQDLPSQIGEQLASWVQETNGGKDTEHRFVRRYLNDPKQQLLIRERILFAYNTASGFALQPTAFRSNLEFRWPVREGKLPVLEEIIHIGIPRAGNAAGAETLAAWLLDPVNQERMIVDSLKKRVRSFGIAGGFSSRIAVNEEIFPRYYSYLSGRIPPAKHLEFPGRLPSYWPDLRTAVILPYFHDYATGINTPVPLESRLQTWLLRRGD